MPQRITALLSGLALSVCAALPTAIGATEYFVALDGSDTNEGMSLENAFATVQRGVDALRPGDTLTIAPGEYFGGVRREGLGGQDAVTTIRAQIAGTATLRGDIPVPEFRKVDGYRFVYAADFGFDGEAHVVNELDSLTVIEGLPQLDLLDFAPGRFFHDRDGGKLYLSTLDMNPPTGRPYTASVTGAHGIHLSEPRRVVIQGLAVTGFNRNQLAPRHDRSQYTTWGIILVNGKDCVIRDCKAYLNGRGIAVSSAQEGSGDNVVERCAAWGNDSQYGTGDSGGLTIHAGRRDVIRDSVSFRNGRYGVNIRSEADGPPPRDEDGNHIFNYDNKSRMVGNLAWGNSCDFKIKTGHPYIHTAEGCIGPGLWSLSNPQRCLMGRFTRDHSPDNIALNQEEALDLNAEFADPAKHDYRLQATSRFRGAGPDGTDRGPLPYEPNVFFVRPGGDDDADGRSTRNAWRTLGRALPELSGGDTLYLEGGAHAGDLQWELPAGSGEPIAVRGRGFGEARVQGELRVVGDGAVSFERLAFDRRVDVAGSRRVAFQNCRFRGLVHVRSLGELLSATGLHVRSVEELRVEHTLFADARLDIRESLGVHLSGNLFAVSNGPAVSLDDATKVRYSDYNGYLNADACWSVGDEVLSLADLQTERERYSRLVGSTEAELKDAMALRTEFAARAGSGPHGTGLGPHSFFEPEADEDALRLAGPWVHSVTDTTVNVEWGTSAPANIRLTWGEAPDGAESTARNANRVGSFSLTGLKPDTEYFLTLFFDRPLRPVAEETALASEDSATVSFRTAAKAAEPRTYYVAVDGDDGADGLSRAAAWRTISKAASRVGPGDTVLIAGGAYAESVWLRATGEEGRPITFKALPGERVALDGLERTLDFAFFAADKSHLRFDGFYFKGFAHGSDNMPWAARSRPGRNNGAIVLYESHDVHVTRCFLDGRGGGSSPGLIHARHCADLLVQNNVMLNCMGRLEVYWNSPRARIVNNVFLRNFISHISIHVRGGRIQSDEDMCLFERNIVTDNLSKKIHANLLYGNPVSKSNAFYLRVPAGERTWNPRQGESFADMLASLDRGDETLVADPGFKGALEMETTTQDGAPVFFADRLISKRDLDFPDLFATNPDVVERGMGLDPEAFADFHFNAAE